MDECHALESVAPIVGGAECLLAGIEPQRQMLSNKGDYRVYQAHGLSCFPRWSVTWHIGKLKALRMARGFRGEQPLACAVWLQRRLKTQTIGDLKVQTTCLRWRIGDGCRGNLHRELWL